MANYFIDAGSVTGIFLIAGLGIYILTGLCGQISLTQATYMGLGGIISAYLSRSVVHEQGYLVGRGWPFAQSLLVATAIVGLLAALLGLITVRLRGSAALSASIASAVVLLYIGERAHFLSGGSRGATASQNLSSGILDFADLSVAGHRFSEGVGLLFLIFIYAIIVFVFVNNVSRSPLGRAMRVVRERDDLSQTCGISPVRTIVSAHFLCGLTAGIAGSLYAHFLGSLEISSSNPWLGAFGLIASIQILAYVVIGGMRNILPTAGTIVVLALGAGLLTASVNSVDFLNTSDHGHLSPSQATAIISATLVIGVIHLTARFQKSRM